MKISGASLAQVDRTSALYTRLVGVHQQIAQKDPSTWGPEAATEAAVRLNWVDLPESSRTLLPEIDALTAKFRHIRTIVLAGMGGSSLAPEVIAKSFGRELFILDSTDPNYLAHAINGDLASTLVVVSSKSGSTIETSSARAAFAAAFANGGSVDNVKPGIDYLAKLHAAGNVQRVEGTTPYAKFLKGEIPIWIGYENDGLKAKHVDGMGDAVEVVIPKEASAAAPYAISLVKGGPNPNSGKLWLNFIMSEAGQSLFAQGFVRPSVLGIALSADVAAKMPAAPQIRPLDVVKASAAKPEVDKLWAAAVLAK